MQGLAPLSGTTRSFTDPSTNITLYYFDDAEELPDGVSFTYVVKANFLDSGGGTGPASNPSMIVARNDAPIAVADSYTMPQDGVLSPPAATGVILNTAGKDTDADSPNAVLRVTIDSPVTPPQHGSLTINADGSFTYTPVKGYFGPDSFTYKVKDNRMWPLPPSTGLYPMSPDSVPGLVSIAITKSKK